MSNSTEVAKAKKSKRQQYEQVRKASIVHGELRQQRIHESVVGSLSFVPTWEVIVIVRDDEVTTNGVDMIDWSNSGGIPYVNPAGFGKLDPSAC